MQLPIDIKILDDILIKIKELKPSPYNQKGMRDGKIFVDSDRYFINLQAQTYEIVKMEAWNGNQISPIGEITFDTNIRMSCIVQHQDHILLIYREKLEKQYYTLVGGHLQTNEDPNYTIVREVLEESNIHLENAIKLGEFDNEEFGHELLYYSHLEQIPSDMFEKNPEVNNSEVAKLIWMKIDDALKLENLYPNQIQNYIENL